MYVGQYVVRKPEHREEDLWLRFCRRYKIKPDAPIPITRIVSQYLYLGGETFYRYVPRKFDLASSGKICLEDYL